jgi:Flp pilus assembly protein TadG
MGSTTQRTRSRRRSRRGIAIVEFAIVLPIFLLAIIGIIEFGRAVMVQQMLVNAAREGARRAIIPGATNASVTTLVDNYLDTADAFLEHAAGRQVSITDENGNAIDLATTASHTAVAVTVSVPYSEVGVGISSYFSAATLGATIQVRTE